MPRREEAWPLQHAIGNVRSIRVTRSSKGCYWSTTAAVRNTLRSEILSNTLETSEKKTSFLWAPRSVCYWIYHGFMINSVDYFNLFYHFIRCGIIEIGFFLLEIRSCAGSAWCHCTKWKKAFDEAELWFIYWDAGLHKNGHVNNRYDMSVLRSECSRSSKCFLQSVPLKRSPDIY